jgi:hypothetical protein
MMEKKRKHEQVEEQVYSKTRQTIKNRANKRLKPNTTTTTPYLCNEIYSLIISFLPEHDLLSCRLVSHALLKLIREDKNIWSILVKPALLYHITDHKNGNIFPWLRYAILYTMYNDKVSPDIKNYIRQAVDDHFDRDKDADYAIKVEKMQKRIIYLENNIAFIQKILPFLPESLLQQVYLCKHGQWTELYDIKPILTASVNKKSLAQHVTCLYNSSPSAFARLDNVNTVYLHCLRFNAHMFPKHVKHVYLIAADIFDFDSSNVDFHFGFVVQSIKSTREKYPRIKQIILSYFNEYIQEYQSIINVSRHNFKQEEKDHTTSKSKEIHLRLTKELKRIGINLQATSYPNQIVNIATRLTQDKSNHFYLSLIHCTGSVDDYVVGDAVHFNRDIVKYNPINKRFEELP